jgi:hypothetical protein
MLDKATIVPIIISIIIPLFAAQRGEPSPDGF